MPGAVDPWDAVRRRVAQQAHYLRNPLGPAPGVCYVCRGPANGGWTRCYTCEQHLADAQSSVADVVVPISYAVKRTQHAYALAAYKAGAERVAAIVLGRHANPEFGPWEPILRKIKDRPYRQETCALHDD